MSELVCQTCGEHFGCAAETGSAQACWCMAYPALLPLPTDSQGCLCPPCLKKQIQSRIEAYCQSITPEQALAGVARKYARKGPLQEGIDYTLDAEGRFVLSRWYLLKRGHCCQNGCTHCPYGFQPEA